MNYEVQKSKLKRKKLFLKMMNLHNFYKLDYSDYYVYLYCYIDNVSDNMAFILQVFHVQLGSLLRTSNRTLYLIHRSRFSNSINHDRMQKISYNRNFLLFLQSRLNPHPPDDFNKKYFICIYFKIGRSTKRFLFFRIYFFYFFFSYTRMFPACCFHQRTSMARGLVNGVHFLFFLECVYFILLYPLLIFDILLLLLLFVCVCWSGFGLC